MHTILQYALEFLILLLAISIHESAHAWAADKFGDPTAKIQGRITLNPLPHIDLFGTVLFPLLLLMASFLAKTRLPIFGWAKPVMVNPYNLRNPKRDGMYISAAGPLSNLLAGFLAIAVLLLFQNTFIQSKNSGLLIVLQVLLYFMMICIILFIFNLIPIPPLDGSGIIEGLLTGDALRQYEKVRPYGFIILLVILWTGIFDRIADFVFDLLFRLFPALSMLFLKIKVFS